VTATRQGTDHLGLRLLGANAADHAPAGTDSKIAFLLVSEETIQIQIVIECSTEPKSIIECWLLMLCGNGRSRVHAEATVLMYYKKNHCCLEGGSTSNLNLSEFDEGFTGLRRK
jgi:hypothetical protein